MARFDYPSPYWDDVSDLALDLIDRMLTVDVEKRITVDGCLEHPWITQNTSGESGGSGGQGGLGSVAPGDSTDGLTGAMGELDFSKRKPKRERTLLSAINDVRITRTVDVQPGAPPLKVFSKNAGDASRTQKSKHASKTSKQAKGGKKEHGPAADRDPKDFIEMGGVGDQRLFGNDQTSHYDPGPENEVRAGKRTNTKKGRQAAR